MNELIALLSVVVVSLISLVGVATLSLGLDKLKKILLFLVSFAAGGLLGDAFIHLLPETAKQMGFGFSASVLVLSGIVVSFVAEKFLCWRHCHTPTSSEHPHPFAFVNLFGDAIHNFIDGIIIGASYLVSVPIGLTTTLAVLLHEIPQEIGDFGILIHGGFSARKAVFFNFLTALTAILGVIVVIVFGAIVANISVYLLPFAAGSFIYLATADLIPELHKETKPTKSALQLLMFIVGLALMTGLLFFG
ncbi:MAG: ZIP family metal transporter [Candidatus Aenigmatarchaeota archaeon]